MLILKSLRLRVDPNSGVPVYWQVKEEINRLVSLGLLKKGERLPSVRELAITLRVNPNTIAKAYQILEKEKVVTTQKGKGTFVEKTPILNRKRKIKKLTEKFFAEVEMAGFSRQEVLEAIKEGLKGGSKQ